ncbi:hypothetical protein Droror1_Dr00022421 [Drosera rotundifolia]
MLPGFLSRGLSIEEAKTFLHKSVSLATEARDEFCNDGSHDELNPIKQIRAKSANVMPTIVAGLNPEALPLAVPRADELFDEMSELPMVPLLLDFQIDSKYVFEAKAIQRMELLVSSSLGWRMNPVTPFHERG